MTPPRAHAFPRRARPGQALVEATLALLVATSVFLCLFKLSHMLTGKIFAEHAAMRAARARAVGFRDFMCWKVAQVASIPARGRRVTPAEGDEFDYGMELARVPIYLGSPHSGVAAAVLRYEHDVSWKNGSVGDSTGVGVRLETDWFDLEGEAGVEDHAKLYLNGSL